jgi:hypothetical protein
MRGVLPNRQYEDHGTDGSMPDVGNTPSGDDFAFRLTVIWDHDAQHQSDMPTNTTIHMGPKTPPFFGFPFGGSNSGPLLYPVYAIATNSSSDNLA